MPTAKTQERPNRRHVHEPNGPELATERCPWCGSKISRAEFQRIRDQIAEHERARLAEVEQNLGNVTLAIPTSIGGMVGARRDPPRLSLGGGGNAWLAVKDRDSDAMGNVR